MGDRTAALLVNDLDETAMTSRARRNRVRFASHGPPFTSIACGEETCAFPADGDLRNLLDYESELEVLDLPVHKDVPFEGLRVFRDLVRWAHPCRRMLKPHPDELVVASQAGLEPTYL